MRCFAIHIFCSLFFSVFLCVHSVWIYHIFFGSETVRAKRKLNGISFLLLFSVLCVAWFLFVLFPKYLFQFGMQREREKQSRTVSKCQRTENLFFWQDYAICASLFFSSCVKWFRCNIPSEPFKQEINFQWVRMRWKTWCINKSSTLAMGTKSASQSQQHNMKMNSSGHWIWI